MAITDLKFRVLIESKDGKKLSYETSSFSHIWTEDTNLATDPTMIPSQIVTNMHKMVSCSFENTFNTSSITYDVNQTFGGDSFLRAKLKGSHITGSIEFVEKPFYSRSLDDNDGLSFHYGFEDQAFSTGLSGGAKSHNQHQNQVGNRSTIQSSASFKNTNGYYTFDNSDSNPYSGSSLVRSNTGYTDNSGNIPIKLHTPIVYTGGDFTLTFWIKKNTNPSTTQHLAWHDSNSRIYITTNGRLNLKLNSSSVVSSTTDNTFEENDAWVMVTIVRENGVVDFGKNNQLSTKAGFGMNNTSNAGTLKMENFYGTDIDIGSFHSFTGNMGPVKFWTRALSAQEISNEYSQAIEGEETFHFTDRLHRYKFFGNKVCNVLGLAENTWHYTDEDFKLSVNPDKPSHLNGTLTTDYLNITKGVHLANLAEIGSDIPFRIKHAGSGDSGEKDRWIKFTHYPDAASGDMPNHDLIFGYDAQDGDYKLKANIGASPAEFYISGVSELTSSKAKLSDVDIEGGMVTASIVKVGNLLDVVGDTNLGNQPSDEVNIMGDITGQRHSLTFSSPALANISGTGATFLNMSADVAFSADTGFVMRSAGSVVGFGLSYNVAEASDQNAFFTVVHNGATGGMPTITSMPANSTGYKTSYASYARDAYDFDAGDKIAPAVFTFTSNAFSMTNIVGYIEVVFDT